GGDRLTQALLGEATREMKLSSDILAAPGVKERIAACFAEIERAEALSIKRGTGLLASVGSTGPFIGLFGTVWGIMNSFIGISKAQTTNLAVVAPGIAEALLATAVGLFAAIPAVLIYNHLARQATAYLELVSNLSGELLRIVSRDLDRAGQAGANKIHAAE
ncbi:MAG: TonB-system energizer ExbB, partial [Methylocystaceae bacterium]